MTTRSQADAKAIEAFCFIQAYLKENGMPPTRKEIAAHLNLKAPISAQAYLDRLVRKGMIEIAPNTHRGIRIIAMKEAA